jgi:hypothetical protein
MVHVADLNPCEWPVFCFVVVSVVVVVVKRGGYVVVVKKEGWLHVVLPVFR